MGDGESGRSGGTGAPQPPTSSADKGRAPTIGVVGFALTVPGLVIPPLGIVGLVLSAVGFAQARRSGLPTRLSLAGIILGVLACIVALSLVVEWVLTP